MGLILSAGTQYRNGVQRDGGFTGGSPQQGWAAMQFSDLTISWNRRYHPFGRSFQTRRLNPQALHFPLSFPAAERQRSFRSFDCAIFGFHRMQLMVPLMAEPTSMERSRRRRR